jgi:hypothetical protein
MYDGAEGTEVSRTHDMCVAFPELFPKGSNRIESGLNTLIRENGARPKGFSVAVDKGRGSAPKGSLLPQLFLHGPVEYSLESNGQLREERFTKIRKQRQIALPQHVKESSIQPALNEKILCQVAFEIVVRFLFRLLFVRGSSL